MTGARMMITVAVIVLALSAQAQIMAASLAAFLLLVWVLWIACARGSASFDAMLDDVVSALCWIRSNTQCATGGLRPPAAVIFGGYSSGAHVAASLLNRPHLLAARGLPAPCEGLCDGVLYVSGVLATRPSECRLAPSWLTDAVVRVVFGKDEAFKMPSPLHEIKSEAPRVPHLLIGCKHEVFGLSLLDVFFCSADYAAALRQLGVPARYLAVSSDHWRILNSRALSEVLGRERAWFACPH
eukprot:CAMPEP_0119340650 /NCGR_PEP_ID=MMETSP1333-20130426/100782_1 /TAXON_ID=418940 /ORGANISM="Scyphosphaera apsteinii, Strain RCC1455" /LENGTH=240 /DNA_ID=CAMNT_0007352451 /DNA_START=165 /DNA_END=887 /DNA_ORIENTATION=+